MIKHFPNPKVTIGSSSQKIGTPKVVAHVFQITADEAIRDNEVILITFLVNDFPATVLFDIGASRSFLSPTFCAQFVIPRSLLSPMLEIDVVVGNSILVREKFYGCLIVIYG